VDWHYHPLAEEELGEAAVFYCQRTARIGDEFLDELNIAIDQLLTHPESGAVTSIDMQQRMREKLADYDWIVGEFGEQIVGYAYYNAFRARTWQRSLRDITNV
jgi:hypothetical protein